MYKNALLFSVWLPFPFSSLFGFPRKNDTNLYNNSERRTLCFESLGLALALLVRFRRGGLRALGSRSFPARWSSCGGLPFVNESLQNHRYSSVSNLSSLFGFLFPFVLCLASLGKTIQTYTIALFALFRIFGFVSVSGLWAPVRFRGGGRFVVVFLPQRILGKPQVLA